MRSFQYFAEHADNPFRLGRHQMHDFLPESLLWNPFKPHPIYDTTWQRHCDPFDQGQLGSCTANAALGCLMTAPLVKSAVYTEDDCVKLYELETRIDDRQIPGEYPPDDTGSTGPWSMIALQQEKVIRTWSHTRSTMGVLQMLQHGPVSFGSHWFQSMFTPVNGRIIVDPNSPVAGGHQYELRAVSVKKQTVSVCNSWGTSWGDGGYADLAWHDLDLLIRLGGDAVQPVL